MRAFLAGWFVLCVAAGCGGSSGGGGAPGGSASAVAGGTTTPQELRAGASVVDITPPPGGPLAGFGAAPRRTLNLTTIPLHLMAVAGNCFDPDPSDAVTFFEPAQGILDPIYARALVISNGVTKIGIVKLDTIAVTGEVHAELTAYASANLGIPPENLIVAATHTHSGPGAMSKHRVWQLVGSDCYNDRQFRGLVDGCKAALAQADAALRRARVGFGRTFETTASHNRRGRPGIYDTELGIIKVVDAATGAPIAAVLNFAVHGTKHGGSNMLYSADLMGEAERTIEQRLGGGVAMFLNGAEGDVSPQGNSGPVLGNRLSDEWPNVPLKDWVVLDGAADEVRMPRPSFNAGCFPIPGTSDTICNFLPGISLAIPLDEKWVPASAPFKAIRIDGAVLATVPGEAITEIGWDIKARGTAKGFAQTFVIGLANEHLSYITTQAEYFRGEYEGQSTIYGWDTGGVVVRSVDAVMDRVKP